MAVIFVLEKKSIFSTFVVSLGDLDFNGQMLNGYNSLILWILKGKA